MCVDLPQEVDQRLKNKNKVDQRSRSKIKKIKNY